jgi:hypothetical protein
MEKFWKLLNRTYAMRIIFLALCFSICWSGVTGTLSVSSDVEKSEGNKFQAGVWGNPAPELPNPNPGTPIVRLNHIIITEVLYDPTGTDTGHEWVELYNGTSGNVDMSGMELNATSGDYFVFPSGFTLSQYSFVVVHWRAEGTNIQTNLYTGTAGYDVNMGDSSGSVSLFKNGTHSKDTIIDFLEYGAGDQTWENDAVDANIWTEDNFIPDVAESHSIEKIEEDIDANLASEFKDQAIPNPGL